MHNNHKRSKYLKISKSIKEFMFEKICFFNTKKKKTKTRIQQTLKNNSNKYAQNQKIINN